MCELIRVRRAVWIIAKNRPLSVRNGDGWRGANQRTMLHKIIRRAGFEPWPRAWNNLRASRATELAEIVPGHVAAAWLGHSEEFAGAHDRQVLPEHFEKAARGADELSDHSRGPRIQQKTAAYRSTRPFPMEAGGIEPPSCDPSTMASTCVVR